MEENKEESKKHSAGRTWQVVALFLAGFLITGALVSSPDSKNDSLEPGEVVLEEAVLPSDGVVLPVVWGRLGSQMTEAGVIEKEKFLALYGQRGGLTDEERALLEGKDNGYLTINSQNAGALLNLLWALGLANDNPILKEGPMVSPQYGGDMRWITIASMRLLFCRENSRRLWSAWQTTSIAPAAGTQPISPTATMAWQCLGFLN